MEGPFSKIPRELVLQIAKSLPTESSYCLALTTRSLFYDSEIRILGGLDTKRTEHHRRKLLPLLAKDWPDKTFCDYCAKLHPCRDTPKVCKDWQRWSSCPRKTSGMWLHLDPWDYHIQFEDVYKVMESHRSGRDDLHSITLHTDWQAMDYKDMDALDCKIDRLTEPHEGVRNLGKRANINKGCLKKLDVVPLILDDSLIMTTTQRMFYHAEQRDDLLNYGIGRHVFRPCSHWNWSPGEPGGDYWQQRMPSVERLVTDVLRGELTPRSSENDLCLYAQSLVPWMCYCCSTEYTLRVWNHGDIGIELSLETWTKLGSCETTEEIWWLTAAQHTCDTYSLYHCERMQSELPWGDPATGAPRFDFLLRQSRSAVLDPSFLRAFKDLCDTSGFTDTSATAPDNYATTAGKSESKKRAEQYQKKAEHYRRRAEYYQKMAEQPKQHMDQSSFESEGIATIDEAVESLWSMTRLLWLMVWVTVPRRIARFLEQMASVHRES